MRRHCGRHLEHRTISLFLRSIETAGSQSMVLRRAEPAPPWSLGETQALSPTYSDLLSQKFCSRPRESVLSLLGDNNLGQNVRGNGLE